MGAPWGPVGPRFFSRSSLFVIYMTKKCKIDLKARTFFNTHNKKAKIQNRVYNLYKTVEKDQQITNIHKQIQFWIPRLEHGVPPCTYLRKIWAYCKILAWIPMDSLRNLIVSLIRSLGGTLNFLPILETHSSIYNSLCFLLCIFVIFMFMYFYNVWNYLNKT